MDLDNLNVDIGELICSGDICIYRNEYAYIIFKLARSTNEVSGNCLLINGDYYTVKTVEDLRTYSSNDF